jgi:hypothetical protein
VATLGRYAPFNSDEDLIEMIVPKKFAKSVQMARTRFVAGNYVISSPDFPTLIRRLRIDAKEEKDRVMKMVLLLIKAKVELVWQGITQHNRNMSDAN